MRPGLVILGLLILLIGAGILVGVNLFPPGTTSRALQTVEGPTPVPPGHWVNATLASLNGSDVTVRVAWRANQSLSATLFSLAACPGATPSCLRNQTPIAAWTNTTRGVASYEGAVSQPFLLRAQNAGNRTASLTVTATSTVPIVTPLSPTNQILIDTGAGILIALGGLGVFLGFFLRKHPYEPRPPPVSRDADDAEGIVAEFDSNPDGGASGRY